MQKTLSPDQGERAENNVIFSSIPRQAEKILMQNAPAVLRTASV
jgi:hypothetical protein